MVEENNEKITELSEDHEKTFRERTKVCVQS